MEATILCFSVKRALDENYRSFVAWGQPGRRGRHDRGAVVRSGRMTETSSTRGRGSQNRTKSGLVAVIPVDPNRKSMKHESAQLKTLYIYIDQWGGSVAG
jgi:hypothetical protein